MDRQHNQLVREEREHNGNNSPRNNMFGVNEPTNFTFPSTSMNAQLESYIRSDVVNQIVAEKIDNILKDPRFLERVLSGPEVQQSLVQFFSSAQGSEVLKNVFAQCPSLAPAILQPNYAHVPMHVDNQPQARFPKLTLLTWNILAPSFAKPHFYGYCSQSTIRIEGRFKKITSTIIKMKPDVICLQEMEPQLHNNLAATLGPEYQGSFANHEGKPDGCSLFIKSSLGQIEVGAIKLSFNKSAVIGFVQGANVPGFWVCSVHLTGDPNQADIRLLELKKALETRHDAPFLLAGDFNETEHDSGYKYLQSIGFKSACRHIYRSEPERTFKTDRLDRAIDFVFYSHHFEATDFEYPSVEPYARLPNEEIPSDHVFLKAQLAFK